jgi:hypothetical protein
MIKLDFDICANRHGGADTSVEAYESTPASHRQRAREEIVAYIKGCGLDGAITDEVADALDLVSQSASARMSELKALGTIIDSGQRRRTRNGKFARVMVAMKG